MTSANEIQIGGNHYKKGSYEHWDWAITVGLDYLASAASKYIVRWRDKNGVEDLRKAGHYIDKLIEVAPLIIHRLQLIRPAQKFIAVETRKFVRENALADHEASICYQLALWDDRDSLSEARGRLNTLILENITGPTFMTPRPAIYDTPTCYSEPEPVPLEDSNKHADRT